MYEAQAQASVKSVFGVYPKSLTPLGGSGIGGVIFKAEIEKPPYTVVAKMNENSQMLKREYETVEYIAERADIRLPKLYALVEGEGADCIVMECFDGISCSSPKILNAPKKLRLALSEEIADNIIRLQQVKGEAYGDFDKPLHSTWLGYYRPFAAEIIGALPRLCSSNLIDPHTASVAERAFDDFYKIFYEKPSPPTLTHGDYWAANIIADKNLHLVGVVDPFNSLWADSEYELFALNAVYGAQLPVLESFKEKATVSESYPLKSAFYYFFSEIKWVIEIGHDNREYLKFLAKELEKQMSRWGIN